ncbi:MAG: VWA domain-containing protein [Planctomycetes bacterium]|nr:VWA domain-containing protein [Planctomycetota bacterium]
MLRGVFVPAFLASAVAAFGLPSRSPSPSAPEGLKENLDLPLDAGGDPDDDDDYIETIRFYGSDFEADGFFPVVDRSKTMQDRGELPRAKSEATRIVQEFSSRVQFGLFFFDKGLVQFPGGDTPAIAHPPQKQSAVAWIQTVAPGSGTCGQPGLVAALRMANRSTAKRRVIVYISDGGGTCPGSQGEAEYLRETLAVVTGLNYQRIRIDTIGVIDVGPLQEEFLRQLAASNGGTYRRISR